MKQSVALKQINLVGGETLCSSRDPLVTWHKSASRQVFHFIGKMKSWSIWREAAPQNYKVYPSVTQVHLDSCHPGLKDDSNYFSTLCEKLHQLRINGNCQSYRESTVGLTNRHFLKISGKKLSLGISWKRMEDPD